MLSWPGATAGRLERMIFPPAVVPISTTVHIATAAERANPASAAAIHKERRYAPR